MLKYTFLHIPGIGYKTENYFWHKGICSWYDFFENWKKAQISSKFAQKINMWLEESEKALKKKDISFFAERLPRREWWRLYPEFKDRVAFLDIETTGLSFYYDDITLIGVYDGDKVKTFIQGQNLHAFKKEITKYQILVTYNGTLFDLPFINYKLGLRFIPSVHIDLRFLLRRLGFRGSLKDIEQLVGINREQDIINIGGFDATVLWNRYVRGDDHALEVLVKYNIADTVSLRTLLEFACKRFHQMLLRGKPDYEFGYNARMDVTVFKKENSLLELRVGNAKPIIIDTRKNRRLLTIGNLLRKLKKKMKIYPKIVGIDLSGSEKRRTGWALLKGTRVQTRLLKTDEEIVESTVNVNPDLISIDSPLSLPRGRDCTKDSCECRKFGIMREAERILRNRGVYIFPSLIRSMQPLTERGIKLRKEFEKSGFMVIESYPGATQDILRIVRKKISLEDLKEGLKSFGLSGEFVGRDISHDELDAITAALVGYFYLTGDYEALGNEIEGYLIVPKIGKDSPLS